MTAPDGMIRIPLNEEASGKSGQIEEYLMQFNGEGIQHIALLTDDLMASTGLTAQSRRCAADDRTPPRAITRCWRAACPTTASRCAGVADAAASCSTASRARASRRLLLQIFQPDLLGPVFFEFIQRKGDDGFGEGNFKALCSSRWSATSCAGAC
jgi:4-hydroxyphenylpyruvate dioxygenase